MKNVNIMVQELDSKLQQNLFVDAGKILLDIIVGYNNLGHYAKTKEFYKKYMPLLHISDKCLQNALLNEYELSEGKTLLKSYPRQLYLMLTNSCNLNCIMCLQRSEKPMYMPNSYKEDILAMAPYLEQIVWQGGEVLIYNGFKDMLFKMSQYNNIKHCIVSNFQVDDDKLIELLPKLNIQLNISIDGSTKELYEKIRINAKFEKLVSNIEKFNNIRFKQSKDVVLCMHFVVMKENYNDMVNIVEFAYKNGFNQIIYICISGEKRTELDKNDKEKILFLIDHVKQKAEQYQLKVNINSVEDYLKNNQNDERNKNDKNNQNDQQSKDTNKLLCCHLPWRKLTFDTNYNFVPDCQCLKKNSYIGKSILECWNDVLMQKYREQIIDGVSGDICGEYCCLRNR